MAVVAFISCVKTKRPGAWPAQELYCSTWFKAALGYAAHHSDPWFILSARYGLLRETQRVESYEETLKGMPFSRRRLYRRSVPAQRTCKDCGISSCIMVERSSITKSSVLTMTRTLKRNWDHGG